jgi:hypothetical protein
MLPALVAFFLMAVWVAAPPASGLEEGRVGILYIGGLTRSPPFWHIRSDPLFSFNFVLATLRAGWAAGGPIQQADTDEAIRRMVRLYMPRTYSTMVDRFDIIVLSNSNRDAVGPKNIEMLARGVTEGSMSLFMDGGMETLGGTSYPPWGETAVGKLLPTEDVEGVYIHDGRFVVAEPDHELMNSLPWDTKPMFVKIFYHNLVTLKPGAQQLAYADLGEERHPAVVTWELVNGARTFVWSGELHKACMMVSGGSVWEYCTDLGANILIYLAGLPVPQDIDLVHRARSEMFQTTARKNLLFGLLDFAENFGANVQPFMVDIDEVDLIISEASQQYLDLDFEGVLETYLIVSDRLNEIEEEAVEAKNNALFWVYIIEWSTVTAASLITGVILWALMVRRRLYREVRTTRLV